MHGRGGFGFAVFLFVLVLVDLYAYKALNTALGVLPMHMRRTLRIVYWLVSIGMLGMLIWLGMNFQTQRSSSHHALLFSMAGIFFLFFLPKVVLVVFHGAEDIIQFFRWSWWKVTASDSGGERIDRIRFLSQLGLLVSAVPFAGVLYGMTMGRRKFRVEQVEILSSTIPAAFNGLRVVQISDLHLGSFSHDSDIVQQGVELIQAQSPDIILFTGDLVNDLAEEVEPWLEILSRLEAPMGKFSILGNHDYSDYARWDDPAAKRANMVRLQKHHSTMGFHLLLDEHVPLEKDGERIGLLGCQNWGRGFQQYGDLAKTMSGTQQYPFRMLMTHDPTHWKEQVWGTGIDLTLSGHTHGAQFGVKINGTTYSPAQWIYEHWAGLYENEGQQLYVNRGFGFIGFPGRVGMPPEITVLELKST